MKAFFITPNKSLDALHRLQRPLCYQPNAISHNLDYASKQKAYAALKLVNLYELKIATPTITCAYSNSRMSGIISDFSIYYHFQIKF